jgi:ketosteroid isomerase-like protein
MKFIRSVFIIVMAMFLSPIALSDNHSSNRGDVSEVMAVIEKWAALESDLRAQAELIRDDRVQISQGIRQSDQAGNLAVQLLKHDARVEFWGGEPMMMVRIEDPLVRVYGDVAVASFMRLFDVAPPGERPGSTGKAWFSLVLVKERGEWKIAHNHVSAAN